ncbi:MAG TPA: DNA polymerase III subunit delta' [Mycobacteriales bacterium]|nr:DNA polymerase III subunit delta' [Mycobacteriales bacterium]
MTVFDALVGQDAVVHLLKSAVAGAASGKGMTHAWLFTGPPGSGRSVAARAFAAALQCPDGGCGTCHECHTALSGAHPDVNLVVPQGLHLVIADAREIVAASFRAPSQGRWQITLIEDADRMEERTSNTLLKALEEPPPRGVFLLCAPTPEDLLPTIRSRCRQVTLRIPPYPAVAAHLEREGVDAAVANWAARAAQGHVGRARRFAVNDEAKRRRREVLELPTHVSTVGGCFTAAANLVEAARDEARAITDALDEAETAAMREAVGDTVRTRGAARPRGAAAALSELEKRQGSRAKRTQRDALDRALIDLAAFYRDVLVVQLEADVDLVNVDLTRTIERIAGATSAESTLRRIDAILACREAIDTNVAPLLAVEAMAVSLHAG